MIGRNVRYELVTVLATFGLEPDLSQPCKEWNYRLIELWRVLSQDKNEMISLDASHKATMMELRNALPRPLHTMIDIDKLTGPAELRMSLMCYISIILNHHLTTSSSRNKSSSFFAAGNIWRCGGNDCETPDNLVLGEGRRATEEAPALLRSAGTFSAYAVVFNDLDHHRLVTTLAMAACFSATTKTEQSCQLIDDVVEMYEDYDSNKETSAEKNPVFIVEPPKPPTGDQTDNDNDAGTESPKKRRKFDSEAAKGALVNLMGVCNNMAEAGQTSNHTETMRKSLLAMCEFIGCGQYSTIKEAQVALQQDLKLLRGWTPTQLNTFLTSIKDLSNNQLQLEQVTATKASTCLSWYPTNINATFTTIEPEDKLRCHMIRIPPEVFIHIYKKIFRTRTAAKYIDKPSAWVNKLHQLFVAVEKHEGWISTLGNTGKIISNIDSAQSVLIVEKTYLSAMGVDPEYKQKKTIKLSTRDQKEEDIDETKQNQSSQGDMQD